MSQTLADFLTEPLLITQKAGSVLNDSKAFLRNILPADAKKGGFKTLHRLPSIDNVYGIIGLNVANRTKILGDYLEEAPDINLTQNKENDKIYLERNMLIDDIKRNTYTSDSNTSQEALRRISKNYYDNTPEYGTIESNTIPVGIENPILFAIELQKWNLNSKEAESFIPTEMKEFRKLYPEQEVSNIQSPFQDNAVLFWSAIDSIDETISPSYDSSVFIGRTQNIYRYNSTSRQVSITFKIAALRPQDHENIIRKIDFLKRCCYPSKLSETIGRQLPLIRFTVGDKYYRQFAIVSNMTDKVEMGNWVNREGLLDKFSTGIFTGLENEISTSKLGGQLPTMWDISLTMDLIEEVQPTYNHTFESYLKDVV